MTAEAKAGFMGSGVSIGGSAGMHGTSKSSEALKLSIKSEVSSAASVGTTTTHFTTCSSKEGDPDSRTGLWQWVITSEDYSVSAFTPHTVCRTGRNAFTEPECSYWDCNNADCTKCKAVIVDPKDDILGNVDDSDSDSGLDPDND